jgi:hypothetical protein
MLSGNLPLRDAEVPQVAKPTMQTDPAAKMDTLASDWEPISDVPMVLEADGRNYIEWTWSLLDDGIELSDQASFSTLKTAAGKPLLAAFAAEYLDEQMLVAKKTANQEGHGFADVILCCKAPETDSGKIADDLLRLFFCDAAAAVARAKSLGEICDVAEDFNVEAIYLKMNLATDERLPKALRDALKGPVSMS